MLRGTILILLLSPAVFAADPAPNRLAKESSPYLLQYAHQPVNWYAWGPEPFEIAKKEGKLIFFSSGFSSCHWCHVMAKESFADAEVAAILNKHFICIKVDREERPDVDHVYLTALNVAGQRGGWPLSMFITDDGKPISGGTYWPKEDRVIEGQPMKGFKTVLREMIERFEKSPDQVRKSAEVLAERTRRVVQSKLKLGAAVEANRALVNEVTEELKDTFDPENGGFGGPIVLRGPKFPRAPSLLFLEHEAKRTGDKRLLEILDLTLGKIANGGLYDQLGGGFHRYCVDRAWTIPHFEKMLPDPAQLLEVYARAYEMDPKPRHMQILRESIEFVKREMTSPEGGFYSSLDADSEGSEGKYYIWTQAEIDAALPIKEDRELIQKTFGLQAGPNFEKTHFVFNYRQSVEAADAIRWQGIRQSLMKVREKRVRPGRDQKILTSWNGQMIAGLAVAGKATGDATAIVTAEKAAGFLLKTMKTSDNRLWHSFAAAPGEQPKARVPGMLEDYVFLTHGLLQLHTATGKKHWLDEALVINDTMIRWFEDADFGGYFATSSDHEKLFVRAKDQYDGAAPSGNSQAVLNFVRIAKLTGVESDRKKADKAIKVLAPLLKDDLSSLCTFAEAVAIYLDMTEKK